MKATELRIGNIVHATTAGNVGGLEVYVIANGSDIDNAIWWVPIPLTEEWLLRLGFQFMDGVWKRGFIEVKRVGVVFDFVSLEWQPKLDYVHQLQNFCYALDGEELTLTNEK